MKTPYFILISSALAGVASAAVVTDTIVQNRSYNWSHTAGAVASQSTEASGGVASRAIDGNYDGFWAGGSITHTDSGSAGNYWQVDLGASRAIDDVTLFNRLDSCCGGRLSNYSVLASNVADFSTTVFDSGNQASTAGASIGFAPGVTAQYVRVMRNSTSNHGDNVISLAEVDVILNAEYSFTNMALGSTAFQTSDNGATSAADSAIDGDFTDAFNSGSTTHTNAGASGAVYWETTFGSLTDINEIALYNRGDCCPDRLSNFRVSIFDGVTEVWGQDYFKTVDGGDAGDLFSIQEDAGAFIGTGDRVRIELIGGLNNAATGNKVLSLQEVEIFGSVVVPEPSSTALLGLGGLALILRRKK